MRQASGSFLPQNRASAPLPRRADCHLCLDGRGFRVPDADDHAHSLKWVHLGRVGLVALACIASWFGVWRPFASFDVVALVATLVGGYPIFREAFTNILARRMTMELSMTIALI